MASLLALVAMVVSCVLADPELAYAQQAFQGLGCTVTHPRIDNIELSNSDTEYATVKNLITQIEAKIDEAGVAQGSVGQDYPEDCSKVDSTQSGVFTIKPVESSKPVKAYCDMTTGGGGWTVIQRRTDGSTGFNRGWVDYRNGFGSRFSEYWLGNENLFWLTAQDRYELRIDMTDFQDDIRYAFYDHFRVGDEGHRYKLLIGSYSDVGEAGDALGSHNHAPFTTPDYDNDQSSAGNCAGYFSSGWWFTNCYHANLNGVYRTNGDELDIKGVVWSEWRGLNISLKSTEMKIRPRQMSLMA